ncbi:MAG: hypothetical protein WAU70_07045 [Flavobacteriales bacterium]
MRTLLARLVLVFASIPAMGTDVEAEALVLDNASLETTQAIERRLGQQLKNCVLPVLDAGMNVEGDLVVNVRIEPDGSVRVVNAHGGNTAMRNAVNDGLNGTFVLRRSS